MTSPLGNLLAGLGRGAVEGLQYRDRQRLLQDEQERRRQQDENERQWRQSQLERLTKLDAYQRERDAQADQLKVADLLNQGFADASDIATQTARERAAPSVLDGVIQQAADRRVAGGITVGGRKLVAPGENALQRADRVRLEQSQDREREREADRAARLEERNLMLAQQRAQLAETRRHNMAIEGAAATRAQGGGQLRAPTEAQEKSFVYYGLMSTGTQRMKELGFIKDPKTGQEMPNPKIRPLAIKAALGLWGGNMVLNAEEQEYMKAARDFAAGVLRKESGAAIKDDELRDVFARYIDAPFDLPNTRRVKSASRDQYMGLMQKAATPALRYYESIERGGLPAETRPDPTSTRLPFSEY